MFIYRLINDSIQYKYIKGIYHTSGIYKEIERIKPEEEPEAKIMINTLNNYYLDEDETDERKENYINKTENLQQVETIIKILLIDNNYNIPQVLSQYNIKNIIRILEKIDLNFYADSDKLIEKINDTHSIPQHLEKHIYYNSIFQTLESDDRLKTYNLYKYGKIRPIARITITTTDEVKFYKTCFNLF